LSDQVIRYDTKQQYIEHKNHLRSIATGELTEFPNWGDDPEAYWEVYYERMEADPDQIFEMWTLLVDEEISDDGSLGSQQVRYETLRYENKAEAQKSQERVFIDTGVSPGVPVSAEFKSRRQAERMRRLLRQGEPGYYYDILHRTAVEVVDTGAKEPWCKGPLDPSHDSNSSLKTGKAP
jgi:hypothetical protein